jgi:hypothetical protein
VPRAELKHDVPFALDSRVTVQGKHGVWIVFDHHGISWEQGTDTDRVVVISEKTYPDTHVPPRYPPDIKFHTTKWRFLRSADQAR